MLTYHYYLSLIRLEILQSSSVGNIICLNIVNCSYYISVLMKNGEIMYRDSTKFSGMHKKHTMR